MSRILLSPRCLVEIKIPGLHSSSSTALPESVEMLALTPAEVAMQLALLGSFLPDVSAPSDVPSSSSHVIESNAPQADAKDDIEVIPEAETFEAEEAP